MNVEFDDDDLRIVKRKVEKAKNNLEFEFEAPEIRNCESLIFKVIETHPKGFWFASEKLKKNKEFKQKCLEINSEVSFYFEEHKK